ncbi:MFS transporter [Micromonospora sp. C28SCA-DRY-2]|uniref:MFS transporter n=1 Tax=Micromonospora sp. C28SCA-DRY-2 TaxID=3059522 RepID=UPI002675753A|nr:MFS transporter [Micromonospora sp. C28SCA-DRY-2]MDO3703240.1 MFS transporter [Micromonospora sp. C28SCA-DRY-2]
MMTENSANRAGLREWIGLAVLVLPTLLLSVDVSVLHLAVPMLSADLRPSSTELLWINDSYGFLIAGFLLTMGALGDRYGRKRLLLVGAAAFGAASTLAAYAPTAELLILARALLGIAGATLMPSTLSLIRTMFHDPAQRTVAISVWMTGFTGGMLAGPLIGGLLLEHYWWGSVFLLAVPVMAVLLLVGPWLLPEHRDQATGRIDPTSVLVSLAGILALVYGFKQLAAEGVSGWPALALLAGLALIAVFVRRQRTLAEPLLDLRLFADRRFSVSLGTLALVILVGPGLGLLSAQYLQLVLGLTPLRAGLWMLPQTVAVVVGFLMAPALARRLGPGTVAAAGLVISAGGLWVITLAGTDSGPGALAAGLAVFFLGASPLLVLGTDLVVGAAPPEQAGAASAVSETAQELGGALGLAVFGSIANVVYRHHLSVPPETPPEVAASARDTLGAAVDSAAHLPDGLAEAILTTAKGAFTSGLHTAAVAGSVLLLLAAVLSATLLRRAAPATAEQPAEPVAQQA